jgi:hypothetical protein
MEGWLAAVIQISESAGDNPDDQDCEGEILIQQSPEAFDLVTRICFFDHAMIFSISILLMTTLEAKTSGSSANSLSLTFSVECHFSRVQAV